MLEIVLLFFLCKSLGNILREKGRTPIGYQILLVVVWFGAEFMTGLVWGVVQKLKGGANPAEFGMGLYLIAMLCAAIAGGCVFLMVKMLPSLQPTENQFGSRTPGEIANAPVRHSDNPFDPPRY